MTWQVEKLLLFGMNDGQTFSKMNFPRKTNIGKSVLLFKNWPTRRQPLYKLHPTKAAHKFHFFKIEELLKEIFEKKNRYCLITGLIVLNWKKMKL